MTEKKKSSRKAQKILRKTRRTSRGSLSFFFFTKIMGGFGMCLSLEVFCTISIVSRSNRENTVLKQCSYDAHELVRSKRKSGVCSPVIFLYGTFSWSLVSHSQSHAKMRDMNSFMIESDSLPIDLLFFYFFFDIRFSLVFTALGNS